jgi:signal transduction histidine kinase
MKPAHVWSLFGLCLAIVLLAMGWTGATVIRLDRAERAARSQAVLEENARLALWRMDSALTALFAQESGRPYFQYEAFYRGDGAYGRPAAGAAEPLVPSPLLRETPAHVVLHFQLGPGTLLTSPQVPRGDLLARALREGQTSQTALAARGSRLRELQGSFSAPDVLARLVRQTSRGPATEVKVASAPATAPTPPQGPIPLQKMKGAKEFEARQQSYLKNTVQAGESQLAQEPTVFTRVQEGTLNALWLGERLLLARRVRVGETGYVQGCWLDWSRLQAELLGSVRDLLPAARLERVDDAAAAETERRLATLPVRLVPGAPADPLPADPSPLRFSLVAASTGVLLAVLSVAALLGGVMALSERRRVFVSAVTHELRTPLTTFRLYTDMLAEGMVIGEQKERDYLGRLRNEAQRLQHLVENVLFYARLEGGRAGAMRETVDLAPLLDEVLPRLSERAAAAGLQIVLDAGDRVPVQARIDRSAIEQILVNLVDNACKYGRPSDPPVIQLALARSDRAAVIRFRDHGPGLSPADRRRLFRPFSKSDREAAGGPPGVGLGLALSRRLARAQGGELRLDETVARGAAFVLTLPLDPPA